MLYQQKNKRFIQFVRCSVPRSPEEQENYSKAIATCEASEPLSATELAAVYPFYCHKQHEISDKALYR